MGAVQSAAKVTPTTVPQALKIIARSKPPLEPRESSSDAVRSMILLHSLDNRYYRSELIYATCKVTTALLA